MKTGDGPVPHISVLRHGSSMIYSVSYVEDSFRSELKVSHGRVTTEGSREAGRGGISEVCSARRLRGRARIGPARMLPWRLDAQRYGMKTCWTRSEIKDSCRGYSRSAPTRRKRGISCTSSKARDTKPRPHHSLFRLMRLNIRTPLQLRNNSTSNATTGHICHPIRDPVLCFLICHLTTPVFAAAASDLFDQLGSTVLARGIGSPRFSLAGKSGTSASAVAIPTRATFASRTSSMISFREIPPVSMIGTEETATISLANSRK